DERFGNAAAALGARTIWFAKRNAVALNVLNHSRSRNLGGKVNDRPNYPARFDGGGNHAAGIDPLQPQSIPFTAKTLEVPPRDSILRADHGGIWTEYRLQMRGQLRQAVRLHTQKDDVHRSHFFERTGDGGVRDEISLGAFHLHAVPLHGAKMRPAREEGDVEPGLRHAGADVAADGARACDQESHACLSMPVIHAVHSPGLSASAAATARR